MATKTKVIELAITYDESRGDPVSEWDWFNLLNMGPEEGVVILSSRVTYERGVRDGLSRARSKPGDGDMGG